MTFPKAVRSGFISYNSWAPPKETLKPLITSSNISMELFCEETSLTNSRNDLSAGTKPIFPATGSIIIAAKSLFTSSKTLKKYSLSL